MLYIKRLKHNLISISQLCDKGFKVLFEASLCIVTNSIDNGIILIEYRQGNVYIINLNDLSVGSHYLVATNAKVNKIS